MQDAVGPGVAAAGDPCPLRRGVADGSLLECQQRTQRRVREAAVADQIADGHERRHPDGMAFRQLAARLGREIGPVLDRVDPGSQRGAHGAVAVGVRHDGKALVVGDFRELCNEILRHRLVGQNAVVIEIHQPGDHKLDKVSAAFFDLCDKRAEIVDRFKAAPDEAPVVPLAVDRKDRRAVADAVFWGQLRGQ